MQQNTAQCDLMICRLNAAMTLFSRAQVIADSVCWSLELFITRSVSCVDDYRRRRSLTRGVQLSPYLRTSYLTQFFKVYRIGTERHLPYEITQCYLLPDRGKRAPSQPQPDRPVVDLPATKGWKAELTLVLVMHWDSLLVRRRSPIHVVTTWQRSDRELNQRPRDCKFNILIVTLPSYQWVGTSSKLWRPDLCT